jgi:hypothetical protein
MLYIAYLDEFGHIGPYISHDHPKHKTHPVFGLGGVVLPYDQVRKFSTFFYQLKNNLLQYEIEKTQTHPAKWEKKGSSLYTYKNVEKYKQLRQATFRLLNQIHKSGGFLFYVGIEKKKDEDTHNSKQIYHSVLAEAIKRLNQECETVDASFMLILDQQEENVLRAEIVERASIEMHGKNRFRLIEPPIQAESHLYQTIQCADWLCGIFGRMTHYQLEPSIRPELQIFDQYFAERVEMIQKRSSIRPCKENNNDPQMSLPSIQSID